MNDEWNKCLEDYCICIFSEMQIFISDTNLISPKRNKLNIILVEVPVLMFNICMLKMLVTKTFTTTRINKRYILFSTFLQVHSFIFYEFCFSLNYTRFDSTCNTKMFLRFLKIFVFTDKLHLYLIYSLDIVRWPMFTISTFLLQTNLKRSLVSTKTFHKIIMAQLKL